MSSQLPFLFLLLIFPINLFSQILNPSFEGPPTLSVPPPNWFSCNEYSTPDTQPGSWSVTKAASEGDTYVSLTTRGIAGLINDNTVEGIGTQINVNKEECYEFLIDLAHSEEFYFAYEGQILDYEPVKLKVYASDIQCKKNLIWTSPLIDHSEWKSYRFNLQGDFSFIMLEAAFAKDDAYAGNILIDNIKIEEYKVGLLKDTLICQGSTIELEVDDYWDQAEWINGEKSHAIEVAAGNYSVVVNKENCILSDQIVISYPEEINIDLGEEIRTCSEDTIKLNVLTKGGEYLWNTGSTNPEIFVSESGLYSVEVSNGCDVTYTEVDVNFLNDCCGIYAPNIFTPNQDGINDNFEISTESNIVDYKLTIFNKWGRLIYSTTKLDEFWSGNSNDKPLPSSVYYWSINLKCIANNSTYERNYKGILHLVR